MHRSPIALLLLGLACVACDGGGYDPPPFEPPPDDQFPGLADEAEAFLEASGAEGGLLAVHVDGEPMWATAVGRSGPLVPMRTDMLFKIGSNTKTFTAAAILLLSMEGVVNVDGPIEPWLPGLVPNGENITVGHLLTHTSGIFNFSAAEELDRTRDYQPEELVAIATSRPPSFPPGAGYEYSNTGYVLLGMIIERASGSTWEDFTRTRFLEPLGLHDTYMDQSEAPAGQLAHGYEDIDGVRYDVTEIVTTGYAWSAGSMVSTLADLTRWAEALYGGEVLDATALEAMTHPWVEAWDYEGGYGLGTSVLETPFGVSYGHGGGIAGYRSFMETIPDADITVIALLTTITGDVNTFADLGFRAALGRGIRE